MTFDCYAIQEVKKKDKLGMLWEYFIYNHNG